MISESIRLGFSAESANGQPQTISESLDLLEARDVDTVEVPLLWMELVLNGQVMPERLAALKAALKDRPFQWTAHAAIGLNFTCDPAYLPLHMALARAHLQIAGEIGAEHMVLHTGSFATGSASAQMARLYDQQRESLLTLAAEARECGVILCVENIFSEKGNRITASPSQLAAELRLMDHPNLVACLDVSHAALQCDAMGLDFEAEVAALIPLAKHVHLHDSFGRSGTIPVHTRFEAMGFGTGDLHLPLGWGNLPFDRLLSLGEFPAATIFNVELNKHLWHGLDVTVAEGRRLARLARVAG